MNRLEWLLGFLLVVLLVIVAILSILFWYNSSQSGIQVTPTSVALVAPTSAFQGQTARVAFAAAQRESVKWQADAKLLSASATWPTGASSQEVLTGETTWGFVFYSPTTLETAVYSVAENQAVLISQTVQKQSVSALEVTGWNLDSSDVMKLFFSEGGSNFMSQEGVTTVTMMLTTNNDNGRIEWLLSAFSSQTGHAFTIRVDATSGDILEKHQS